MSFEEIFRRAFEELSRGRAIALITIVGKEGSGPRDLGSTILYSSSGLKVGTIGGGSFERLVVEEARKALSEGKPRRVKYALRRENVPPDAVATDHACGGVVEVFINVVKPAPRVIVFGAGNVGKPLADLANALGYRVLVLDADPELASAARYPYAEGVYAGNMLEQVDSMAFGESDVAIIAYGEVETDYQILKKLLQKGFPGHIWALCSRRRCAWMIKRLFEEGVRLDSLVGRLHMPAGLDIKSDTPEEIAVSIFAEVICTLKGCEAPVKSLDVSAKLIESLAKGAKE